MISEEGVPPSAPGMPLITVTNAHLLASATVSMYDNNMVRTASHHCQVTHKAVLVSLSLAGNILTSMVISEVSLCSHYYKATANFAVRYLRS